MPEPCRSCDRREIDFGGCRCQAFLLTGDAAVTDPVCQFAPQRHLVEVALQTLETQLNDLEYRTYSLEPVRIH